MVMSGGQQLYGTPQTSEGLGSAQTVNQCGQSTLKDRINKRLAYSQDEARRSSKLQELSRLLESHPEVCRILELFEELQP